MSSCFNLVLTYRYTARATGLFPKQKSRIQQCPIIFTRGIEIKVSSAAGELFDDKIISQIDTPEFVFITITHHILWMHHSRGQKHGCSGYKLFLVINRNLFDGLRKT